MNRFCLICKFLCVLFLINKAGLAQVSFKGDSLMAAGQFEVAAVYYEKALFDQSQRIDSINTEAYRLIGNELLLKKIQCQKYLKHFEDAWQTAQRIDLNAPNDSLQYRLRYEVALTGYLSRHYGEAHGQILQIRFYVRDSSLLSSLDILEILTLNELERWAESKEIFRRYAVRNGMATDVEELYGFLKKKPKSPEKAQFLSFIMPGVGQMYAGYPKAGIVSIGLQTLALGFGVYHVWHRYYLIGFFTGAGMFQAFYFGGARRAELMAEETNRKRKTKNNQRLRTVLIESENKKGK
jgi:TM2 domain-containing membrane protein YozV